jgi:hypothetical protein
LFYRLRWGWERIMEEWLCRRNGVEVVVEGRRKEVGRRWR